MRLIPGQGVVIDGHDTARFEARTAAAEYLIASHHWTVDDADEATEFASVAKAWWGGEVGFVNPDHPAAQPVTVVNLPTPMVMYPFPR